jgi:hypothetical protein
MPSAPSPCISYGTKMHWTLCSLKYTESNRQSQDIKENTEKILPSFVFFSVSRLAKGRRTYLLRISKEWRGLRFSLYVPSTYLHQCIFTKVGHTYVLNSDEGLTDRAQYMLRANLSGVYSIKLYVCTLYNQQLL